MPGNVTFQVFAIFRTKAIFEDAIFRPCMFRTALCPDRCNHSKYLARFKITEYLEYNKLNEYGDEKSEVVFFDYKDDDVLDQDVKLSELIPKLRKNSVVYLDWNHIYVNDNNKSHYPARPIKRLELISEGGGDFPQINAQTHSDQ